MKKKGFTLIELLIVIAVIGILAAFIVPNFLGFMKSATVTAANTELGMVNTGVQAYMADAGVMSVNLTVSDLTSYLSGTLKGTYTIVNSVVTGVTYPGATWLNGKWVK